jgi:ligand-binding SRPBCC domain-containing protein
MNASHAIPYNTHIYEKSSTFKTTMERMIAFHQDPKALSQLTPPPIFVQLLEDKRVSFAEGDLRFRLWFGFIPINWHARHEAGKTATSFADVMIVGQWPIGDTSIFLKLLRVA